MRPDVIGSATLPLKCRLSNLEVVERQELLAKETSRRGRLEEALEQWKASKKAEQKILEGEVTVVAADCVRLARSIETGEETRQVDVEYRIEAAQVQTVRLDTEEVISARPAQEHELQLSLPGAEPENEQTFRNAAAAISAATAADVDPELQEDDQAGDPPREDEVEPDDEPEPPRDIDGIKEEPTPADDDHELEWGDA